jgi:hypothetical protein
MLHSATETVQLAEVLQVVQGSADSPITGPGMPASSREQRSQQASQSNSKVNKLTYIAQVTPQSHCLCTVADTLGGNH